MGESLVKAALILSHHVQLLLLRILGREGGRPLIRSGAPVDAVSVGSLVVRAACSAMLHRRVGALDKDVPLALHSTVDLHPRELARISRVQLHFTSAMCKTLIDSLKFKLCIGSNRLEPSLIH